MEAGFSQIQSQMVFIVVHKFYINVTHQLMTMHAVDCASEVSQFF